MGSISDNILSRVKQFISQYNLLPSVATDHSAGSLIIGFSGGPDSMALTHILERLGYHLLLTHCHFGLRDAEADRDFEFCRQYAQSHHLPFESIHFDTKAYMAEHHLSAEMACRELRYNWWNTQFVPTIDDPKPLCIGHHQDDTIETFLMNLMRGTGIDGLTGIQPRNGRIIRPLLGIGRKDILAYLADNNLDYVTDHTNAETIYMRNKVRNLLVPMMQDINGNAKQGILNTIGHLNDTVLWANTAFQTALKEYASSHSYDGFFYNRLDRAVFPAYHLTDSSAISSLLFEFFKDKAKISEALLQNIAQCVAEQKKNLEFMTDYCYICLSHREVIVAPNIDYNRTFKWNPTEDSAESKLPFSSFSAHNYSIDNCPTDLKCNNKGLCMDKHNDNEDIAHFDADKLKMPLTFRRWQAEDKIRPLGMKGNKLVSDLFSNQHLSPWQKKMTWVVTDATHTIIWVTHCRMSQEYSLSDQTRNIIRIVHKP